MSSRVKPIALIQGGLGAEREISLLSGRAVAPVLDDLKLPYEVVEGNKNLPQKLSQLQPSVAFLAVHGQYAEDGTLQGICEYLNIPYTGSGVLASSLCMNKCIFKNFISLYRIPTPSYQNLYLKKNKLAAPPTHLKFPLVVKPAREGSSLGISICPTEEEWGKALEKALQYDRMIVVESYIKGRELALSFLDGRFLTPVEIRPKAGFYDYTRKYTPGETEYILPARVSADTVEQCKKTAARIIKLTSIRGYCRADFIVKDDVPFLTEINTLPGLTASSLLPKSAAYDGIRFPELIQTILRAARLDYEKSH